MASVVPWHAWAERFTSFFPAVIGPALTEDRAFKGLERAEGEAFLEDLERGTPSPDGSLGSLSSAGEGSENSI